jgi:hypothetical protein
MNGFALDTEAAAQSLSSSSRPRNNVTNYGHLAATTASAGPAAFGAAGGVESQVPEEASRALVNNSIVTQPVSNMPPSSSVVLGTLFFDDDDFFSNNSHGPFGSGQQPQELPNIHASNSIHNTMNNNNVNDNSPFGFSDANSGSNTAPGFGTNFPTHLGSGGSGQGTQGGFGAHNAQMPWFGAPTAVLQSAFAGSLSAFPNSTQVEATRQFGDTQPRANTGPGAHGSQMPPTAQQPVAEHAVFIDFGMDDNQRPATGDNSLFDVKFSTLSPTSSVSDPESQKASNSRHASPMESDEFGTPEAFAGQVQLPANRPDDFDIFKETTAGMFAIPRPATTSAMLRSEPQISTGNFDFDSANSASTLGTRQPEQTHSDAQVLAHRAARPVSERAGHIDRPRLEASLALSPESNLSNISMQRATPQMPLSLNPFDDDDDDD